MLSITIDQSELNKIKTMLSGIKYAVPKVTQMAVNRTLAGVRTDATNEVAKVIALKKNIIRNTITVMKMGRNNSAAWVKCGGKRLPLMLFSARELKSGKGVTVKVLTSSGRSLIKHAFITEMKTGHKGVFWRKKGRGWNRSNIKRPKNQYAKMPKKYRLPMEERFSFSIPEVMGNTPTMNEIMRLAEIRLKKEVDRALNYELSKLK